MTTIPEMDEFFNFEDAAHETHHIIIPLDNDGAVSKDIDFTQLSTEGTYDIDLAFAEPENDMNSFNCIQHFSAPEESLVACYPPQTQNGGMDTTMMGPDDFMDFPRWIDGMDVPTQPCGYCRHMRIHCKVINEGNLKGSCTACVALHRTCSFVPNGADGKYKKRNSLTGGLIEGECDASGICIDVSEAPASNRDSGDWSLTEDATAENSPTLDQFFHSGSNPNLESMKASQENPNGENGENNPKVGARFSRESLRILRDWLSTHHRHPYPSDDEKNSLKRLTGLNKTQITNWLANARRRGKVRAPRSTSPSVQNYHPNGMDIPRRATPGMEQMTPLDRWKHSPPENEPASITAISKAVTSSTLSSGRDSPYSYNDDGSNHSLWNVSSTSSLGTSQSSGGSFASAYSHQSKGSFGSFNSMNNRGRRRRRRQAPKAVKLPAANAAVRTFQCTFCTETFKTKHDWQRHEKSLHLSLERWVCSPDGPAQFCTDTYTKRCVFCGLANPPTGHSEEHNYLSCADRSLEERTFYRKDHLRQHLNLVHDVKFQAFSMETWKVATPEIRSRCGFCGIIMDTWSNRVDHLAEHFKGGKSMADWKGDWGFDSQVLDIVENGMPPYLIHEERSSMDPYEATKEVSQPEKRLEDWVKIGLVDFLADAANNGVAISDDDLLFEARKIIRRAEERSSLSHPEVCWFRDLIMLSGNQPELPMTQSQEASWAQKLEKITTQAAKGNDLGSIHCSKQRALKLFVNSKQNLGLTPTNSELQEKAWEILDEAERQSSYPCPAAVNWFKYLIYASTGWLEEFRRKVGLPRTVEMAFENIRSTDDTTIDYTIHNAGRLERELVNFVHAQRAAGLIPTDADLQREARLIIYGNDDPWNQTLADDPKQLFSFKCLNGLAPRGDEDYSKPAFSPDPEPSPRALHWEFNDGDVLPPSDRAVGSGGWNTPINELPSLHQRTTSQPTANLNSVQPLKYFLNDAQCYGRLLRELTRFVKTSMSLNNPNQHVPSDAELQHHARVVIYDDDDPWNQTAADNAEWLIRFKRDVGLAPPENGPGLVQAANSSWRYEKGGTGFSPPYVCPKSPPAPPTHDLRVQMDDREFDVKAKTAAYWLKNMSKRYEPPAQVFCSRELESGLNVFMKDALSKGTIPSDCEIREKAREILGCQKTSADDVDLLEKFKALHGLSKVEIQQPTPLLPGGYPIIDDAMLAEFDKEIEGMDFSDSNIFPMQMDDLNMSMSMSGSGEGNIATFNSTMFDQQLVHQTSPLAQQAPQQQEQAQQPQPDYADLFRVNAATSSPLRRRASEKLAQQGGFMNPATALNPLVTKETVVKEKVHRLQGSGEVSVEEWQRWGSLVPE